jgi:hypothetical protein
MTLIGGVAAWPLAAHAQQGGKVYRIGLLHVGPPPPSFIEPLPRALSELGHVEGRNLVFDFGIAERVDQLPGLAADLIRRKADVILASGRRPFCRRATPHTRCPSSLSRLLIRSRRAWSQAWRDRAATLPD